MGGWSATGGALSRLRDTEARLAQQPGSIGEEGGGIIHDVANLIETPQRERTARAANLAALSAYLGPEYARRRGVSEQDAENELAGGVADPEAPIHAIARNTLGKLGIGDWKAPEGEDYGVRMGRLSGLAARYGEDAKLQGPELEGLSALVRASGELEDPSTLAPAISALSRRAGLGDVTGSMKARPRSDLGEYRADPATYEKLLGLKAKYERSGREEPTFDRALRMYIDPDQRENIEGFLQMWKGGDKGERDPVSARMAEALAKDPMTINEFSRLHAWQQGGRKGPRPSLPHVDMLNEAWSRARGVPTHVGEDDAGAIDAWLHSKMGDLGASGAGAPPPKRHPGFTPGRGTPALVE